MNNEQKKDIAKLLMITAKLYDRDIGADVALMIVEDMADLDYLAIKNALSVYRKDAKNKTWPRAADIRNIIHPQIDSKDLANEMARKIDKTVAKFGWAWDHGEFVNGSIYFKGGDRYHHTFKEAVIAEIGEIGWHTVCSRGGWLSVRNSANEMEEGIFIAQMRDQIQSSHRLQLQGIDITQIEMPKPAKEIDYQEKRESLDYVKVKEIPK